MKSYLTKKTLEQNIFDLRQTIKTKYKLTIYVYKLSKEGDKLFKENND